MVQKFLFQDVFGCDSVDRKGALKFTVIVSPFIPETVDIKIALKPEVYRISFGFNTFKRDPIGILR